MLPKDESKQKFRRFPAFAAAALLLAACNLFEFTPYEVPPGPDAAEAGRPGSGGGASWSTSANLERLSSLPPAQGPWSLAVLADSHSDYDNLARAVKHINADTSIAFAMVAGDVTQYGLLREFGWFRDAMKGLKAPWLTVIGNHDALANGAAVYRNMFGPLDYSFTFRGTRFICANTNAWEFDSGVPDWSWLGAEVHAAPDSLRLFLVSHVAPFGDQFGEEERREWRALTSRRRVDLSIHGHQHNYRFEETYGDGVRYLVADDVGSRNYVKVTVSDTGVAVERVYF